jgi:polyhydroxyalkanoate synthesis repressor PhaR
MPYVIKRYSNRKLYDTQDSRYVTLDEIEEMIRAGREVQVLDATNGEDLTSVTLSQILLETERSRRGGLPASFLHQLIKHGEAWQEFVQRSMRASLEGIITSQREMDRVFRDWAARAGWPAIARPEARREGSGAESETDKLREEVASLREQLRNLEERLDKRRGDARGETKERPGRSAPSS